MQLRDVTALVLKRIAQAPASPEQNVTLDEQSADTRRVDFAVVGMSHDADSH